MCAEKKVIRRRPSSSHPILLNSTENVAESKKRLDEAIKSSDAELLKGASLAHLRIP